MERGDGHGDDDDGRVILRRLSTHVREQNWTAVGLDFLIVVVGVYLGIALGEWNSSRKDQALERDYLTRIRADLLAAVEANEVEAAAYRRNAAIYEDVLIALETCAVLPPRPTASCPISEDRFAMGLFRTGKHSRPAPYGHTLAEMETSGQLRLISDPDLRSALSAAMSEADETDSVYDQIDARVLPYTNYIEQRVRFRAPNDNVTGLDGEAGTFDADLIVFDFDAMRADPLFTGAVSGLRHAQGFLEVLAHRNAEAFQKAADRIGEDRRLKQSEVEASD